MYLQNSQQLQLTMADRDQPH